MRLSDIKNINFGTNSIPELFTREDNSGFKRLKELFRKAKKQGWLLLTIKSYPVFLLEVDINRKRIYIGYGGGDITSTSDANDTFRKTFCKFCNENPVASRYASEQENIETSKLNWERLHVFLLNLSRNIIKMKSTKDFYNKVIFN